MLYQRDIMGPIRRGDECVQVYRYHRSQDQLKMDIPSRLAPFPPAKWWLRADERPRESNNVPRCLCYPYWPWKSTLYNTLVTQWVVYTFTLARAWKLLFVTYKIIWATQFITGAIRSSRAIVRRFSNKRFFFPFWALYISRFHCRRSSLYFILELSNQYSLVNSDEWFFILRSICWSHLRSVPVLSLPRHAFVSSGGNFELYIGWLELSFRLGMEPCSCWVMEVFLN